MCDTNTLGSLCGHGAENCFLYLKSDGPQFWDSVDGKLKTICEIAHARHPEDPVSAKKAIHT
jgi:hypothetical protein